MTKTPACRSQELEDLALLALFGLVVPLIWILVLGWRPGMLISWNDGVAGTLPQAIDLARSGGAPNGFLYRLGILGGVQGAGTVGVLPAIGLLLSLGASAPSAVSLDFMLIQSLWGFLIAKAATGLAGAWLGRNLSSGWRRLVELMGLVVLLSFAPALGWKIFRGHELILIGTFPFLAALSLGCSLVGQSLSRVQLAVTAVSFGLCFCTVGFQTLVYGATLGLPILVGLLLELRSLGRRIPARTWSACVLAACAGMVAASPQIYSLARFHLGPDAMRSPGGERAVYSFGVPEPVDWLASVPWDIQAARAVDIPERSPETNFPLGPMLLGFALVPLSRCRRFGVGVAVSFVLTLILSSGKPAWASNLMILALPPLGWFRAPMRGALIPLAGLSTLLAAGLLWAAPFKAGGTILSRDQLLRAALALLAGAGLFWVPSTTREILAWVSAAVLVLFLRMRESPIRSRSFAWLAPLSLAILVAASLAAFRDRVQPVRNVQDILSSMAWLHEETVKRAPELSSALERVQLDFSRHELAANTAYAAGLSSLAGYWYPPRRLVKLIEVLSNERLSPLVTNFDFTEGSAESRAFQVLARLYNVRYRIRVDSNDRLEFEPLNGLAGPAWFSQSLESVPSIKELGERLRAHQASLGTHTWVLEDDPAAASVRGVGEAISPDCARAKVISARSSSEGQTIRVRYESPSLCPLTVAANYSAFLRPRLLTSVDGIGSLKAFPSYGTLLGVLAPAGAHELLIEPAGPGSGAWFLSLGFAGAAFFGALALFPAGGGVGANCPKT